MDKYLSIYFQFQQGFVGERIYENMMQIKTGKMEETQNSKSNPNNKLT